MLTPILAAMLAVIGISAVVSAETGADPATDAAKRANAFALELYQQQAKQAGNIVFSPTSVQLALSMAAAGAAGDTATQMNKVLGLAGDDPHAAEHALQLAVTGKDSPLKISNNLWLSDKFDVKPEYVQSLKASYDTAAARLNFGDAIGTAKVINDAVAKQTNDKIKDLVPPDAITPLTRLILTNAVHFKADWTRKFEANATSDQPFHLTTDKTVDAKTMHATEPAKFFENDSLKAIELSYVGKQFSMWVIAPKAVDGLPAVEQQIADLPKWIDGAAVRPVAIALPKFKFESQFSLPKALAAMGMPDAFDGQKANFSGISTSEGLFIGDVIHKAMIDVNETGTEAAAATAVMMRAMAMRPPQNPAEFTADRPFLVVLRHDATGAILFLARVADPTK